MFARVESRLAAEVSADGAMTGGRSLEQVL